MNIWLHQHYGLVWLMIATSLFIIIGGFSNINRFIKFGDIKFAQSLAIKIVVSFIGACLMSGVLGFTYAEDPDNNYPSYYMK